MNEHAHILDKESLSANDVLLIPKTGMLLSRNDAELKPYIYSAPMDRVTGFLLTASMLEQGEYPVVCRELPDNEYLECLKQFGAEPNCFFAVGASEKDIRKFLELMLEAELPEETKINVAVDVAHGDSKFAHAASKLLRSYAFIGHIMSGSICTPTGAALARENGCSHIRIGVGPGSMCTTRMMTGCGYPQLSAVWHINKILKLLNARDDVVLIADGGIKHPGDAVKYLAAGADAIMMGSTFSKAIESPGWKNIGPRAPDTSMTLTFPLPEPEPIFVKRYRGHASAEFQLEWKGGANRCPEGASSEVFEHDGHTTVKSVCEGFRGGMASALSYLGLTSMDELKPENVNFIRITTSTYIEGQAHGNS